MSAQLFKFNGGVKLSCHKEESSETPIAHALLPSHLIVPLSQSAGAMPLLLVKAGDRVLKGQMIGKAESWVAAAVHAPTSGTVREIGMRQMPHPSGLALMAVVIEPDGKDRWIDRNPVDYRNMAFEKVQQHLQDFGVVGLGGAVFPSHVKLGSAHNPPLSDLIINGAECEPYITCDDRLMRERADEIVAGIGILRDLLKPKRVWVGIEDNKPEAIESMRKAVAAAKESFQVLPVPTLYPAGSFKQLIKTLTGQELPVNKLPIDLGVQCFNIATVYSAARALIHNEPVISRIVTLTGNVQNPGNWEAPIGMPVNELLKLAKPNDDTDGVIMGGPMMGFLAPSFSVPIVKATNCLIARSERLFPPKAPEMPCIRCGTCARACPQNLQPYEMYWWSRARKFDKVEEYQIANCIECGCCAYVCPANIPLVQYFRFAKGEINAGRQEQAAAEAARSRFEFRQFREAREKAEKAERLAKAAAKTVQKIDEGVSGGAPENAAPDEKAVKSAVIAAALERSRAQRANAEPKETAP